MKSSVRRTARGEAKSFGRSSMVHAYIDLLVGLQMPKHEVPGEARRLSCTLRERRFSVTAAANVGTKGEYKSLWAGQKKLLSFSVLRERAQFPLDRTIQSSLLQRSRATQR
jgi:hypothetical protein